VFGDLLEGRWECVSVQPARVEGGAKREPAAVLLVGAQRDSEQEDRRRSTC
jgi:hypothetical protein